MTVKASQQPKVCIPFLFVAPDHSELTLDHLQREDLAGAQEKKLQQIVAVCGVIAEKFRRRIAAVRTKQNFDSVLDMKRRTIAFLQCVHGLDKALRRVGKAVMDVNTTVQLAGAVKGGLSPCIFFPCFAHRHHGCIISAG